MAVRKMEFQGWGEAPNIHEAGMTSFPAVRAGTPAAPAPHKGFVTGLATCTWFKGMAGNKKWVLEGEAPQATSLSNHPSKSWGSHGLSLYSWSLIYT